MSVVNPEKNVPRKVEEALLYRLKQHAMKQCKDRAEAYAQCCTPRVFSAVWACREDFRELNECLQKHTNPLQLNELKRRWLEAGQPEIPNWEALLQDL
ncbi:g279 [Coccomyxa viridis]|uniref:COX assembly mitochondrial protein n=1 Tax=Coccomyxa viridis TaxID=1274662 RepID=A0ABP1FFC2_9CHLO